MHLFIEKGLRGGMAVITKRYAKANHKDVPDYDAEKPSNHLIYLDANNLYGWAMSQYLPTHDFQWLSEEDIRHLDVDAVPDCGETGYVFEVDLEYPNELHDLHNDYPLAPEPFDIQPDMLSAYQKALQEKLNLKATGCNKLVPNLYDKKGYVVHYHNLKLYLSLGLRLTKVHRVLSFKQSPWLKPYIDFNTNMRKEAKNEFEKDFFKLMNNAVFGKTMENLRKRVDIQLVHQEKRLAKLTKKTKLQVIQDLQPGSGLRGNPETETGLESSDLRGIFNFRLVQGLDVRISLPLHEEEVWIQCTAVVHRHGLSLLRGENP